MTNIHIVTAVAMQRNVRKEYKFSDGAVLPAGSKIGAVSLILHRDPEVYENPDTFDGFRFYQAEPGAKLSTQVMTGNNFHLFGHGRHPWYDDRYLFWTILLLVRG
jgi:cytochrome P450